MVSVSNGEVEMESRDLSGWVSGWMVEILAPVLIPGTKQDPSSCRGMSETIQSFVFSAIGGMCA